MESIEQLRRDPRPLISLGTASAATGESLGHLLSRLADKSIPLLIHRPPHARIYCVTPTDSGFGQYQESVLDLTKIRFTIAGIKPHSRGNTYVEASHFRYLVLMEHDYSEFLDGGITLSIKLFNQAATLDKNYSGLGLVSATQYFRKHFQNSSFPQWIKAKFACYFENEKWSEAFSLRSLQAKPEELLVSRTALLGLIDKRKNPNEPLPPGLTEHLQPWKSELLRAMNIAAYRIYSHLNRTELSDFKIEAKSIKEAIAKELIVKPKSDTKLSTAATLLRPDLDNPKAKNFISHTAIQNFPYYFSYKLMYLNDKCKKYHDNYINKSDSHPVKVHDIENELKEEKVIPENTIIRISSAIKPIYNKFSRSGK